MSNRGGLLVFKTDYPHDIETEKFYNLTLKQYKNSRSLEQNAAAWLCIDKLSRETGNDKWQIYCDALRSANQEAEYILALPKAEQSLKKVYRVVEMLDETREINGKKLTIFKCYLGSSKLNTSQFANFIDYLLRLCAENNIVIDL